MAMTLEPRRKIDVILYDFFRIIEVFTSRPLGTIFKAHSNGNFQQAIH